MWHWLNLRKGAKRMRKSKKKYLSSYLLQQSKINRLKQMIVLNPDLEKDYKDQIAKSIALRNDIEKKISLVDGGILSEILFQKYILGRTLEEISLIINYSKRHTERMHITALEKFKM